MTASLRNRVFAEFVGTACIVGAPVALSAAGHLPGGDSTLAAAAWVSGLPVGAMAAALAPWGGAHMNPAVSVALAVSGRFPWRMVPWALLAQLGGAVFASFLVRVCFGPGAHGVHVPAIPAANAVGLELVLAFLLTIVVFGATVHPGHRPSSIPLVLTVAVVCLVWVGGPATGGSMNPARSTGPALVSGGDPLRFLWVYWLGPMLGATLAALAYRAEYPNR
ncbi:MAG: MIP/aquaporin family protein [Armatimonadaceae bacterium]